MYSQPLAYFFTWCCYGTRLHGDERGSVDRGHNRYESPVLPTNPVRVARIQATMSHDPYHLGAPERAAVRSAVHGVAAHRRWRVYDLNVRTEHVHLVIEAGRRGPELVLDQFKGWATRGLRDAKLLGEESPAWAVHGSTVYVWNEVQLYEVIDYVMNRQGPPLD